MRTFSTVVLLAACIVNPMLSIAADDSPLPRGTREIGLNGIIYVTHDSPEDVFGVITLRGGYYVANKHQIGIDATVFAYSRIQDTYLSAFYRYIFAGTERRVAPFMGASAGANVSRFGGYGGGQSLIVKAEGGLRFMMTSKFAMDVTYNLMYRRKADYTPGLTGPTSSIVTFGFSRIF
jgi:hypothetical protein